MCPAYALAPNAGRAYRHTICGTWSLIRKRGAPNIRRENIFWRLRAGRVAVGGEWPGVPESWEWLNWRLVEAADSIVRGPQPRYRHVTVSLQLRPGAGHVRVVSPAVGRCAKTSCASSLSS